MKKCNRTLLIDGDILFYKFAFANEGEIMFDDPETEEDVDVTPAEWTDMERARMGIDEFIFRVLKATGCSEYLIIYSFDTVSNFRYKVLPSYKGNRTNPKPELWSSIKEYILDNFDTKTKPGIEADDILGIMQTKEPDKYVIASTDKDMRQVPGYLYNWDKESIKNIPLIQANHWFYMQTLTGDACDFYKGCPGIGPKKALEALERCRTDAEFWSAVVKTYESKHLTEEDALQQARVARILRSEDYNFKKNEVILWTPKLS